MTRGAVFSLRYGEDVIAYTVNRQPGRTRRVAIHVEPDGRVVVDAPAGAAQAEIASAVSARARWIHGHVLAARQRMAHVLPREYVSGESLPYLGRRYRLKVNVEPAAGSSVRLRGGFVEVTVAEKDEAAIRAALDAWYRQRARAVFGDRLAALAPGLRWVNALPPVSLRAMKVQWGSCSPAGRLTLNPHLVKAPRECIDYVLLHELCHLREHNHGKRFFKLLDAHMPGWPGIKERLDNLAEVVLNT